MSGVRAAIVEQAAKIVEEGIEVGPRLDPCSCGAGRHAHGGKSMTGSCPTTGCSRYRADPAWTLAYQALDAAETSLGHALRDHDNAERKRHYRRNPRQAGQWSIGASDTQTCPRKIQYRNAPPEDFEPLPEDNREARIGTIIHNEVTRQLKALYPWRLFNLPVTIDGLDRKSELDVYDPVTACVDDIKTAGDWRWDRLAEDGPDWTTWEQVLLYALALVAMGYRVTKVRLIYVKRCNGHDEVYEMPFDQAAAERARDRLLGYAEALDRGEDLPKTGTGPSTDALCRRCFARADCWNIPRAEALGRSPENVTVLGEDPDDATNAWAIQQRYQAQQTRLAAEKVEKEAAAIVDGIPPGRYGPDGEWEAHESPRRGNPNHKAHAETLLTYLDLPDDMRPAAADVAEPPRYRGTVTKKYGPVRKSVLEAERKAAAKIAKEG